MDQDEQARADLGRAPLLIRPSAERALLTAGVVALFLAGYFGIGAEVAPAGARDLGTPLDARIPFVPGSIGLYLLLFPASLLPLFVVRSQDLFRRVIAAYAAAIAVSVIVFVSMPVTSAALRADPAALDRSRFASWAVSKLYAIDPPVNLFPSLHLSIATLAALCAVKARRAYAPAALSGVALIALSTFTVKQHYVADAVSGLALGAAAYAVFVRPFAPAAGDDPGFGPGGLAAFAGVTAAAWAALYVWFRLDV